MDAAVLSREHLPYTGQNALQGEPKVAAIVPAYNEEQFIARTIESLYRQTYPLAYVWVIVNNCTDHTENICRLLQGVFGPQWLRIYVMPKNEELKAGAMNMGFHLVNTDEQVDYVFGMDSDTLLDEDIIEQAVCQFALEPETGGICAAYKALPLGEIIPGQKPTFSQKLLWYWQNIEFSLANAWRVENYKSARVLPGVASAFRIQALRDVLHVNAQRGKGDCVWVPSCQVEDYLLTLDLKEAGWAVKSSIDMVAWSDVPISAGALWRQRSRWYSGTVDVIRPRLLKKHSRYEVFTIGLMPINFIFRCLLVAAYIGVFAANPQLVNTPEVVFVTPFLLLPVISVVMQMGRLRKYGDNLNATQIIMTMLLVPNEAYTMWRELMYAHALLVSFLHPHRGWAA